MTTAISAVLDMAAVSTPAAAGKAPEGGAGFEAALSKLLTSASRNQAAPTTPTDSTSVQTLNLTDPVKTDPNGADVQLPQQAITSFLAVFLAMVGQMLTSQPGQAGQDAGAQLQAAGVVDGQASTADQLKAMLDALKQLDGKAQGGDDPLASLFASLVDGSTDGTGGADSADPTDFQLPQASQATTANDQLLELVQAMVGQNGGQTANLTGGSFGKVEAGVQGIDGLAAKAADFGDTLKQVATMAAGMARELAAAGSVANGAQQSVTQSGQANDAGLVQAIGAAKALVQVAEIGQNLNLDGVKGKSEISIQLQPGSLGKLNVQIERTADGVTARIQATTAAGQRAVEGSIDQIKGALQAAGIEVGEIEVAGPLDAVPDAKIEGAPAAASTATSEAKPSPDDAKPKDVQDPTTTTTAPLAAPLTTTHSATLEAATAPVPSASPDAMRLVQDIADQVGLLSGQGKSEFQLQLRPESLGRVHMKLTVDDGGVTVRMQTDSAQAKGMIESNLGQLKQSFQDQGLRVDRFVVEVAAQGQFSQDGQHPRRSRGWVDDVQTKQNRGDDEFAQELAAAGARPVDYTV